MVSSTIIPISWRSIRVLNSTVVASARKQSNTSGSGVLPGLPAVGSRVQTIVKKSWSIACCKTSLAEARHCLVGASM